MSIESLNLPGSVLALLAVLAVSYVVAVLYSWRFGLFSLAVLLPVQGLLGVGQNLSGIKLATFVVTISVLLRVVVPGRLSQRLIAVARTDFVLLLGIFIFWSFGSIGWAKHPDAALVKSLTYLGGMLLLILVALLDRKDLKKFIWVLLVAMAAVVPTGLIVMTSSAYFQQRFVEAGLYAAGGYNPDDFGTLLAVFVLLLIYGLGLRTRRWLKLPILLLFLVGIYFSKTLTAIVTLTSAPVVVMLSGRCADKISAVARLAGFYLVCGLLLTLLLVLTPVGQHLSQTKYARLTALSANSSWDGRLNLWAGSIEMFRDHPVLGVGAGNFPYLSPAYSSFAAHISEEPGRSALNGVELGSPAHDMYLTQAAELGLPGLLLFLWILYRAFMTSAGLYRRGRLVAGFHAALCAILIGGLALNWEYSKFLFLVLGAIAAERINAKSTERPNARDTTTGIGYAEG